MELGHEALLPAIQQEEGYEKLMRHVFPSPGRVDVIAPSKELKLAEENEVSLQIHAPGLTRLEVMQVQYAPWDTHPHRAPDFPKGGWAMLPVLHHADGSAYVKVIPRALGQVVLKITARFPDGGETQTEAEITVAPPNRSPDKFIVGEPGLKRSTPRMVLYLKPEPRLRVPAIQAAYGSEGEWIQINPAFVSFKIRTANDAPIIELDSTTGLIKPLQKGEALLETTFQGWSNPTCILVEDEINPNKHLPLGCNSLLQPGEKLATPIHNDRSQ
jgi:hypothetical protein